MRYSVLLLAFLPIFRAEHQQQFIDATVCSKQQRMCFDVGHAVSDKGIFRFVAPHDPQHQIEVYLSSAFVKNEEARELTGMTAHERLALRVDVSRPLYTLIEPLLEGFMRRRVVVNGRMEVLNIGVGAGSVDLYMNSLLQRPRLTSVEIDPSMVHIAKTYFGLVEDDLYRILVDDGIKVLKNRIRTNQSKLDAILVDACSGNIFDDIVCPVESFRDQQAVNLFYHNLKDGGTVSVGILTSENAAFGNELVKFIKQLLVTFTNQCNIRQIHDVHNQVITCWKQY